MKKILILNGSISGYQGNTQHLIDLVQEKIESCEVLHLKDLMEKKITTGELKNKLKKAEGFIFTSGTYWDSWGSPMQNFLEVATEFEASDIFMGKPAAVIITMHSVGGKGVLSRLQGVLNTLGMLIPPMSGMVYSLAGHLALQAESSFAEDFWSLEDTNVIVHNLMASLGNKKYQSWPVDHKDPKRIWIK
ncbi:MAG: NAD(P)H-dependent oxidoreductase [Rhizobacter sp.]|nr:NAD(P)H-dependent oxidoreductase [Bacteriovorax sp.]